MKAHYVRCGCLAQVEEVVEVDEEVASILTHSRFAEDFTFQPPGGPRGPCGAKPKVSITAILLTKFQDVKMSLSDFTLSTRGQCVCGVSLKYVTHPESPTV